MRILETEKMHELIHAHYLSHYGEEEGDLWLPDPGANVKVLKRADRYIYFKCHILDGTVTTREERG